MQDVVKSYLNELEQEAKGSKQRELEHVTLNIASTKAESDLAITEIHAQADEESDVVRKEKNALRDELLDLEPMMFLGEHRYRELRSRSGTGFPSRYGR